MKLPTGGRANSLTPEQRDTAKLIDKYLGKALADRYVDFCRISAGDFDLRIGIPVAGHALREFDSILRSALAAPLDAKVEAGLTMRQLKDIDVSLKGLGYGESEINRAKAALAPRVNHVDQIKKIVSRLGLGSDGDVARNWLVIREAAAKAHERGFNRQLKIDDAFREDWAKPFESVVRGVVVALQNHYTALANRVKTLAAMDNPAKAVSLFVTEIPNAMSLQWLFYRNIQGAKWLPELVKHDLVVPPQARDLDDGDIGVRLREWPVGSYLLSIAKSGDENDRKMLAEALRGLKSAEHADLRRDGLEILSTLPGREAAALSDVAVDWLANDDSLVFGGHFANTLLRNVADADEREATLKIGRAMLRIFNKDGQLRSLYSHQMYEHALPTTAKALTKVAGIESLQIFVGLLHEAGVLGGKIRLEPPGDYTSVISEALTTADHPHDIFGALVGTVKNTAIELMKSKDALAEHIVGILLSHKQHIFRRIAYLALAQNPQAAPEMADELLLNEDAASSSRLRFEYGELARARFPHMSAERQAALFELIDRLPSKYEANWRKRFEEHEKRLPEEKDVSTYRMAVIRNALWEWRDVLPEDKKKILDAIVAEIQDPDAWKRRLEDGDKSPMSAEDFKNRSVDEVAEYLWSWKPDLQNQETKTALAFELYRAVQADAPKFAAGAMVFKELAPVYVRRFFEGLRHPAQNKARFPWTKPLQLLGEILPQAKAPAPGETSMGGDDPSWFWAALEGAQLLRTGLQQGKDGIEYENAPLVSELIGAIRRAAPATPEGNFEKAYKDNPYFAAENTMLGLSIDLRVLELYWLSKQEGSFVAAKPKEALKNSPDFAAAAMDGLAMDGANGRIIRAVLGRYLSWLFYFGEEWLKANVNTIFPSDKPLRDAAWLGHLANDGGPILPLMRDMSELYAEETEHLLVPLADNEREWRQDRFGEYVLLQYLLGDYPEVLLNRFFQNAPARLRQHVMWFMGRQLRQAGMPEDATARGIKYWEVRLAAAEAAENKELFISELSSIGGWLHDTDLDPKWVLQQMIRMLRAGIVPNQPYNVTEYAAKVADEQPADAVAVVDLLFRHPKTDQWAYTTQQAAIRKILEAGVATGDPSVAATIQRVISFLVSQGESSFLDLSATGNPSQLLGVPDGSSV